MSPHRGHHGGDDDRKRQSQAKVCSGEHRVAVFAWLCSFGFMLPVFSGGSLSSPPAFALSVRCFFVLMFIVYPVLSFSICFRLCCSAPCTTFIIDVQTGKDRDTSSTASPRDNKAATPGENATPRHHHRPHVCVLLFFYLPVLV